MTPARTARLFLVVLAAGPRPSPGFLPETFKASFTEERTSALTGERVSHSGTVEYRRPGLLRFEVEGPVATVVVVGSERTWHYTPPFVEGERGEARSSSGKGRDLGRLLDLMGAGLKGNRHYGVSRRGDARVLTLRGGLDKELGVERVELVFKGEAVFANLARMALVSGGKTRTYVFRDVRPGAPVPPGRFRFKPPPGTNVTRF